VKIFADFLWRSVDLCDDAALIFAPRGKCLAFHALAIKAQLQCSLSTEADL
jgi:hypothetical protein